MATLLLSIHVTVILGYWLASFSHIIVQIPLVILIALSSMSHIVSRRHTPPHTWNSQPPRGSAGHWGRSRWPISHLHCYGKGEYRRPSGLSVRHTVIRIIVNVKLASHWAAITSNAHTYNWLNKANIVRPLAGHCYHTTVGYVQ